MKGVRDVSSDPKDSTIRLSTSPLGTHEQSPAVAGSAADNLPEDQPQSLPETAPTSDLAPTAAATPQWPADGPSSDAPGSDASGSDAPQAGAESQPSGAAEDNLPTEETLENGPTEEPEEENLEDEDMDVEPLELVSEDVPDDQIVKDWYILKVQVNREESIRDALQRRVKIAGLDRYFGDIIVPTEDIAEFSKSGKRRIVKRKLYPGYIMVYMAINDDTWFLVRETPGIGDFTGSAGKPTPMERREVERILSLGAAEDSGDSHVKTAIPFRAGDRVRVKEGYFQNFEGDVESVDEANGRVTVMINIFGRSTPVELEHWQIEAV